MEIGNPPKDTTLSFPANLICQYLKVLISYSVGIQSAMMPERSFHDISMGSVMLATQMIRPVGKGHEHRHYKDSSVPRVIFDWQCRYLVLFTSIRMNRIDIPK